jgi:hypothetical protein
VSRHDQVWGSYLCVFRYMAAWEEFITRVMGGVGQNRELINSAVEETRKGVHVVYPKLVWVASKGGTLDIVEG